MDEARDELKIPAMIEYSVGGELWKCEKFDALVAEMENGLTPANMPAFHNACVPSFRAFRIVRRIFGVWPVEPPKDFDAEDFRIWERHEIVKQMGLSLPKLNEELAALRGVWKSHSAKLPKTERTFEEVVDKPETGDRRPETGDQSSKNGEFSFRDEPLLKEFNFDIKFKSSEERSQFAAMVEGFVRVLREPLVAGVARNALMTRLQLDRMRLKINNETEYEGKTKEFREDSNMIQRLSSDYDESIKKILDLCPWASQIAGKHALQPVISTITAAYLAYKKRDDRVLVDGVFNAMGIKVELRTSKQVPTPRYRMGLVTVISACKEGVLDPNYTNPYTPLEIKKLDAGFREALRQVSIKEGERVVDLQSDDPVEGEFDELAPVVNS